MSHCRIGDHTIILPARALAWAIARSLLFGLGVGLAWFSVAPPRPVPATWFVIGVAIAAIAVAAGWWSPAAGSIRRWPMVSLSIVMSLVLPAWLVVHPGAGPGWLMVVIVDAVAAGLGAVFAGSVARFLDHRADSVAAVVIIIAALAGLAYNGSELRSDGIRWRLDLVQEDYVAAIAAGTVEESGGFVEGDLSGWVWSEVLTGPMYAVVFDETDRLERVTRITDVVVSSVGEQMVCDPIEPQWFWCTFLR